MMPCSLQKVLGQEILDPTQPYSTFSARQTPSHVSA